MTPARLARNQTRKRKWAKDPPFWTIWCTALHCYSSFVVSSSFHRCYKRQWITIMVLFVRWGETRVFRRAARPVYHPLAHDRNSSLAISFTLYSVVAHHGLWHHRTSLFRRSQRRRPLCSVRSYSWLNLGSIPWILYDISRPRPPVGGFIVLPLGYGSIWAASGVSRSSIESPWPPTHVALSTAFPSPRSKASLKTIDLDIIRSESNNIS